MSEGDLSARNHRIAMLIDGDNAQPALVEKMLIEARKYGTMIVRRILRGLDQHDLEWLENSTA